MTFLNVRKILYVISLYVSIRNPAIKTVLKLQDDKGYPESMVNIKHGFRIWAIRRLSLMKSCHKE
jgi:hypothetical protein